MSTATAQKTKQPGFLERMYNGEGGFQIVAQRKKWFTVMCIVIIICLGAILIRGFSLGIDFEGGTRISMPPTNGANETTVSDVIKETTGVNPQSTQIVGTGDSRLVEVTLDRLSEDQTLKVRTALFERFKPTDLNGKVTDAAINVSTVSESWGSSITNRMLMALVVFLAAVFLYITIRLERDMAFVATICLLIVLTVVSGIYALIGFEVSPATVIGLLTILSFSLYDTVVVFDKVKENTAGLFQSTRATYAEQVNLALNQTIMRSLNTAVFSVVPIISLLVIAVGLMGVGTLKDLALVQFIGVIVGAFSSLFFAAPLLVVVKNRRTAYRNHEQRVMKARAGRAAAAKVRGERNTEGMDIPEDALADYPNGGDAIGKALAGEAATVRGTANKEAKDTPIMNNGDASAENATAPATASENVWDAEEDMDQQQGSHRAKKITSLQEHSTGRNTDTGRSWRPGM